MAEKKTDKCAHPACECTVPKGSKYCSPYYEGVGDRPPPANCGHTECAAGETVGAAGYVYQTLLRRQIVWPSNFLSNRDDPLGDDLRLQGAHTKGSQGFSKVTCRREGCTRTPQHIINGSLQHQHLCVCVVLADQRTRQFIRLNS